VTRRAEDEQSFDLAVTRFDVVEGSAPPAATAVAGNVSSTPVSGRSWRQPVRARTTARCPRPWVRGLAATGS